VDRQPKITCNKAANTLLIKRIIVFTNMDKENKMSGKPANGPSHTGNPSGGGRGNNPPKGK